MAKRMKLSFSIPPKARPSTNPAAAAGFRSSSDERDSAPAPLFITVFEPSQTLAPAVLPNSVRSTNHRLRERSREPTDASTETDTTPHSPSSHLSYGLIVGDTAAAAAASLAPDREPPAVLPPLPNTVRFPRSGEPTDAPTTPNNPSSSHASHGLFVRNSDAADAVEPAASSAAAADGPSGDLILRRYKEDMAVLPDQPGAEEYDEVPVEGFGAALLAGYGWKQGDAIGRNSANKETKVVQYDRRNGSQGLGFDSSNSKKRDMEARDQFLTPQQGKVPGAGDSRQAAQSSGGGGNYKVPCLHSHIRVRVVGKNMSKRLYMMKGRVVDVTGPTTCDIVMDVGTEVVQGLEQDMLETVLPPMSGHVLVLCGEHRGVYGRLVEKNYEEQTGVLEDADTRDMISVELDKIAEYVGDPELIGY